MKTSVLCYIFVFSLLASALLGSADLWKNESMESHGDPDNLCEMLQTISIFLLAFGGIILVSEFVIIYKKNHGWDLHSTRIVSITLIIIAGLFLILVGYSDAQIAPMMGLLGTIVGYLLGKGDLE